jgi:2-amino-4-hydroxy-6-hydroxymethyldihydropteridine diphosphokinase
MYEVGLSLGSNIGDKVANIRRAIDEIHASGAIAGLTLSSLYRTAPWGNVDQDWFVNACAIGRSAWAPAALLDMCLECERRMGRERIVHWGPRTIDIDLLYVDDLVVSTADLELPHPEMLNRAFVLVPLAELRPELAIGGVRILEALKRLDATDIVRMESPP